MAKDIVTDVMRLLQELDPHRPHTELWRFERQVRDLWGGQRTYVCKAQTLGKVRCLAESLAAGRPLSEARNQLGLRRRTCERLLRRRWVSGY
jgi:hypothetical protein